MDTFNHEISLSLAKLVQYSPAVVGFSSNKRNILQHIKRLFRAIVLEHEPLDGISLVYHSAGNGKNNVHFGHYPVWQVYLNTTTYTIKLMPMFHFIVSSYDFLVSSLIFYSS